MGTQYLIDSNVVIDYLSGKLIPNGMTFMNGVVNAVPKVSVITKIEWAIIPCPLLTRY